MAKYNFVAWILFQKYLSHCNLKYCNFSNFKSQNQIFLIQIFNLIILIFCFDNLRCCFQFIIWYLQFSNWVFWSFTSHLSILIFNSISMISLNWKFDFLFDSYISQIDDFNDSWFRFIYHYYYYSIILISILFFKFLIFNSILTIWI